MQQIYRCILPEKGLYYNKYKGTEKKRRTAYTEPEEEMKMKITAKKYRAYPSGMVKWHISVDNKCPVDMYRNGNGEICLTWCDADFDICTVKMYRGAQLYELKALLKALSYTL